jgi:hypothetical protein
VVALNEYARGEKLDNISHGQKVVDESDEFIRYTSFIPEDREEGEDKDIPFSPIA